MARPADHGRFCAGPGQDAPPLRRPLLSRVDRTACTLGPEARTPPPAHGKALDPLRILDAGQPGWTIVARDASGSTVFRHGRGTHPDKRPDAEAGQARANGRGAGPEPRHRAARGWRPEMPPRAGFPVSVRRDGSHARRRDGRPAHADVPQGLAPRIRRPADGPRAAALCGLSDVRTRGHGLTAHEHRGAGPGRPGDLVRGPGRAARPMRAGRCDDERLAWEKEGPLRRRAGAFAAAATDQAAGARPVADLHAKTMPCPARQGANAHENCI
ncbi:hypothetical protein LY05_02885 [Oceanicella actignis]|nr:hypothetical protein LY05_02885 [Oceanicella actignis]